MKHDASSFFAGVTVDAAASWTNEFFQNNDVAVANAASNTPQAVISEVGWPSGGGRLNGSVAGLDELNKFMADFVCAANNNGTEYFW
jgi:exo-beta-1,3-glucanase (GH17 family)